jgi:hypothetical protein
LTIRTRDLLGVPLTVQIQRWREAGFSESEARVLVAYKETAVLPPGWSSISDATGAHKLGRSVLFAGLDTGRCGDLEPDRYRTVRDTIEAYRLADDRWRNLAEIVSKLPEAHQIGVLQAAWELACMK